jgi:hypothetical protein
MELLFPSLYYCSPLVRWHELQYLYVHAAGTMSKVVLMAADDIELIGAGGPAWLAAIRQIILRVLPRPMSSASRPPRKSGGRSSVLYPPTLFM